MKILESKFNIFFSLTMYIRSPLKILFFIYSALFINQYVLANSCPTSSTTISSAITDQCELLTNSSSVVINAGAQIHVSTGTGAPSAIVTNEGVTGTSISNSGILKTSETSTTVFGSNTIYVNGGWSAPFLTTGVTSITNAASGQILAATNFSYVSSGTTYWEGYSAIFNYNGVIGSINNSGLIQSDGNAQTGAYSNSAIYNQKYGDGSSTITLIENSGTIQAGRGNGIANENGIITTLTNKTGGLISGGVLSAGAPSQPTRGILNTGTIGALSNQSGATIQALSGGDAAIYNLQQTLSSGALTAPTITTLENSGTIQASSGTGIKNELGTITTLTNKTGGTISGGGIDPSGFNSRGILNTGTIGALSNQSGATIKVNSGGDYAIMNAGTITTIENSGSIDARSGISSADGIYNGGLPTTLLVNNIGGNIWGGSSGNGITNISVISILTNNGNINGGTYGIDNNAGITTLSNSGGITGTAHSGFRGNGGVINAFTNSGSITGGVNGITLAGTAITTLTNTGTITGGSGNGISNTGGSVATLNNAQGAGNSNGALTYSGVLPTNYSIIVNSTSNFGQLSLTSATGSMAFGINSSSSLQANHTYLGVLQGLSNLSSVTNTSGTYNGSAWSLIANTATSGWWDLGYALVNSTDISGAGTIYQSSNLGSSVNPVFNGGTLQVSSAGLIANNFTVDVNNGVIDQNGVASNFSGVISNAVSGVAGSMTVINGGSGGAVTLSGVNTFTGSTAVNTGATLALSGTGSIATSSSVVNNGAFDISATTSGTAVQAISGTGATTLGAKTLAITNASGNLAGVVSGAGGLNITGGTQTLSGVNTFSGGVQVQSGAALSIASSNALGSGALALIGSATVPATLNITDTTTIANAISVAGDPVFNITTGTTTTVSSPITDGGVAGDVVVAGGGTLNLTAVNSYTGLTAIGAGSTLALTGSGSITPSVSVTNNGTLNVSGQTGNVALGGSFTQTSSGSLVMGFSPASNQRLQIAGAAVLAGSLSLQATGGTYSAGKYTLLSANGVTGRFGAFSSNLSSYTNLAYLLGYDANDVYLTLFSNGPSTANTQQSLVNTASSLQNIYTLQNSVLANSLNYDCTEFGPHGICISVGGRNTAVSAANGLNNTSGLLIGAYRPHPNYRVGAYIDQNLSMNNVGSTVSLGNNTPVIGVFGAWNEHVDGTGTEVKVTAAYGQKNTTVTRSVVGTSEAGSGSSQLNSQGAQVVAKYGFGVTENVIVSPYVGIRYTQNNMGGYTEGTSATVTAPLTYGALNTNATTALAGVGASYKVIPTVTTFASAGVETDTNTSNGTYSAAGVTGLTPVNFNANPVRTRPTATLGAYYDIVKNQRFGVTGIYRQEAYQAVSSTTVMATYTIGL